MDNLTHLNNANPAFIDAMNQQYLTDPASVDSDWQLFFKGYELSAQQNGSGGSGDNSNAPIGCYYYPPYNKYMYNILPTTKKKCE